MLKLKLLILIISMTGFMLLNKNGLSQNQRKKIKSDIVNPVKNLHNFSQEGVTREYTVYTPPGMILNNKYPVVFVFHGGGGNSQEFAKKTRWSRVPDKVITVFPQAITRCIEENGQINENYFWLNAEREKLLCDSSNSLSDIDFIDSILKEIKLNYPVDTTKIFASGFSNGMEFILQNLMVERSGIFSAFAGTGSVPKSSYERFNSIKTSLYLSVGQEDAKLLKNSTNTKFKMTAENIYKEPILKNTINYTLNFFKIKGKYIKAKTDNRFRLIFKNSNQNTSLFIFEILKGVGHTFPANENTNNNIDLARLEWSFFKYHEQLKNK